MSSKQNGCERDDGCRSTRRDFNTALAALLVTAGAPLSLVPAAGIDRGRWVLNERDR